MPSIDNIATVISAAVAIVSLLYTLLATRRNERDLEQLRAEFTERQADRDARRDYEYEARKRLYTEFEPLFFQFIEAAQAARGQIYGLASTARRGNLDPGVSWLEQLDTYYTLSVTYHIFAPLAIGRLIQRRLTFVDLTLDSKINSQYDAIRRATRVLARDFELASTDPYVQYDPNHIDAIMLKVSHPEIYERQGMAVGRLDMQIEAFLTSETGERQRVISFGEFVQLQEEDRERFLHRFDRAAELFLNFHPRTRPVLWRLLIAQCTLYRWLRDSVQPDAPPLRPEFLCEPVERRKDFDWRTPNDQTPNEQVLQSPFTAVEAYFARGFPGLK